MITRIDRWVVDHAIGALAAHVDHRLSFEVNLSGVSMGDAGLLDFVERRLAEYVEHAETLEYLATSGVDYAQGFLIGRPVSLEEALDQHIADIQARVAAPSSDE